MAALRVGVIRGQHPSWRGEARCEICLTSARVGEVRVIGYILDTRYIRDMGEYKEGHLRGKRIP